MTDETAAPADAAAVPDVARANFARQAAERLLEADRAAAEIEASRHASEQAALAAAKQAHDAALLDLQTDYDVALSKIEAWKESLAASLEKARSDPGHVVYSAAFARHTVLLADEAIAWVGRHV